MFSAFLNTRKWFLKCTLHFYGSIIVPPLTSALVVSEWPASHQGKEFPATGGWVGLEAGLDAVE
jgi:hypothetical protein